MHETQIVKSLLDAQQHTHERGNLIVAFKKIGHAQFTISDFFVRRPFGCLNLTHFGEHGIMVAQYKRRQGW